MNFSKELLANIPDGLRGPLFESFGIILRNYRERKWEPAELNGGKLCEIVYSVLAWHVGHTSSVRPAKPKNMVIACNNLANADESKFGRSVRIQIPRVLIAMYEIRNNRNVGHVGGDVDPNPVDAMVVLSMAKWVLAELIRIFHDVNSETAFKMIEALSERDVPIIWEVEGKRRVLNGTLTREQESLALLYSAPGPLHEETLADWVGHPKVAEFRRDVLKKAHEKRLIEFNRKTGMVHLSPLGVRKVEEGGLLKTPSV